MSRIKEVILYWYCGLSMEELFILTGVEILVVGVALGLLIAWIDTKSIIK